MGATLCPGSPPVKETVYDGTESLGDPVRSPNSHSTRYLRAALERQIPPWRLVMSARGSEVDSLARLSGSMIGSLLAVLAN